MFNGNEFTPNLLAIYFLNHPHHLLSQKGNIKEICRKSYWFNGKEFTPNLLVIYFPKPPATFTLKERKYKGNHRGNLFCSTEMKIYSKFTCNFLSKTTHSIYFHKSRARLSSVKSVVSVRE